MVSRIPADERASGDATEFVRFCYHRRRVAWPELYDEMCAVASRGTFRGWGQAELAEHGIGFSLFQTAALAELVGRVVAEERTLQVREVVIVSQEGPVEPAEPMSEHTAAEIAALRLVGAAAG
jgi:hypothetical protein